MKLSTQIRKFVAKAFNLRFAAAERSRSTNNFFSRNTSADSEIARALQAMRDRARTLERDNDYVRKYLNLLCDNVIGSNGVKLDLKVTERRKDKSGLWYDGFDEMANAAIERGWKEWCKAQFCDLSKKWSFVDLCNLALRSTARDGEVLRQDFYGDAAKNKYGYAIRLFESDQLDDKYNHAQLPNGNQVRMGVETNPDGAVVAYHFLTNHPGDIFFQAGGQRVRIEAQNLGHLFTADRIGQTRGYTWLCSVMLTLHALSDYEKAELTGARIGAKKLGFFTKQYPEGYQGDGEDENGNTISNLEDGSFQELPTGMDVKAFDVGKPNPNQDKFIKGYLRKAAAGSGVSYTSLSNDLEGVNFTSIRAGILEERERYKAIQRWFIEQFLTPVFENWLRSALLRGAIVLDNGQPLPAEKFDKFNKPCWTPRRWSWVDPKSDIEASVMAIKNGLTSRRRVINESGNGDIVEIADEIEADNAIFDERGIMLETASGQMVTASNPNTQTTDTPPKST